MSSVDMHLHKGTSFNHSIHLKVLLYIRFHQYMELVYLDKKVIVLGNHTPLCFINVKLVKIFRYLV